MNEMRSGKHTSEVGWIVGGAVAILIAGMICVTLATALSPDAEATIAALGGMIATGLAGLFGLHKVNESQQKAMAEQTEGIERIKDEVAAGAEAVAHRLNGELDARIQQAVAMGIAQFRAGFLLEVREVMQEVLREWESREP